jgi:hypothetical protein
MTEVHEGDLGWLDLGSAVYVKFHGCSHQEGHSGALVRFGGDIHDPGYDRDDICVGGISWCAECRGPSWTLHSLDPLHVEPSIQTHCHNHPEGHHGFIRNGRWEDA